MEQLLDRAALAQLLNITKETLDKLRKQGGFVHSITIGDRPRWREQDVRAWLDTKFNDEDRS